MVCSVLKVLNLRFVQIIQDPTVKESMTEVRFIMIHKSEEAGEDVGANLIV